MRAFLIRFLFYAAILGLSYAALKYALPFLMPFLAAFFIAFLLQPLVHRITKKARLNRRAVSVLLLLAFYILAGSLVTIVGTRVIIFCRDIFYALPQVYTAMIAPALDALGKTLEGWAEAMNPTLAGAVEHIGGSLSDSLFAIVSAVSAGALELVTVAAGSVPSFFVKFFLTIVSSFFFVADYSKATSFLARQLPGGAREMLFKAKAKSVEILRSLGRAYAILLGITFAEVFAGLSLLRVECALLIALVTAVVDILPVLGAGAVLAPWGAAMLILGDYPLGFGLLILYGIVTVARQLLEPRIVGRQIGLYPLVTLACMFAGTYLFGFVGLFGLPILATLLVRLNESGDIHLFR